MDDVDWLDPLEMRVWRAFLEANGRVVALLGESIKAESEMTFEDYEVLVHLSESPARRMRMTELSDRLLHSQSRLTQRVDWLVTRGLVFREPVLEDRRGRFASLTDAGMTMVERVAPVHLLDVRRWLIDLIEPAEREVMATVLERVAAAARAESAADRVKISSS